MTRGDEFSLIARHFAPLTAAAPGAFGLTDDAARLDVPAGQEVVVTSDALVAGVHFLIDDPPGDVARKALRVNLSDLAAMGAAPLGYVLAVCLPRETDDDWLAAFAEALGQDQKTFGLSLLGGDTVATPGPLTLTVTAFGAVAPGAMLRRNGAKVGDGLYVSGTIGDAALGLRVARGEMPDLASEHRDFLLDRYRCPRPRLALGRHLAGLASAALDISDGLLADLGHLARASGLGADLEAAWVPLSAATRAALARGPWALDLCLSGGDDYELCFTLPPSSQSLVARLAQAGMIEVTRIGTMTANPGVRVRAEDGRDVSPQTKGYRHF
ncbi:thiamine-phosphate kinase [Magnetospira thiophila]